MYIRNIMNMGNKGRDTAEFRLVKVNKALGR